jgi:23S rRNA (uracil1939-C5)-methyltransferase
VSRPNRKPIRHAEPIELTIERLGAQGDGVGAHHGQPVFVAQALPGERVIAVPGEKRGDGVEAKLQEILSASPDRIEPPCRHYARCGGCSLQHLGDALYRRFKTERITQALARKQIAPLELLPLITSPPGSRRRVTLTALRTDAAVVLGFNERASHRLVDIAECPVTAPAIVALFGPLRALLAGILEPRGAADIVVTNVRTGLDVTIRATATLDLEKREFLAAFANDRDLARLTWQSGGQDPEPLAARKPVAMRFGERDVVLPSGGFLQATKEGEQAIVAAVLAALPASGRVLDLYAGSGTLTFPIAAHGHDVHAVEGDAASLAALSYAARMNMDRITTERRDLEQAPLDETELKRYAAILFDPPRAGAKSQTPIIAQSSVPIVIAVSCNPETFARDAHALVESGYVLERLQPIDQFLWTAHVELVAVFRKIKG